MATVIVDFTSSARILSCYEQEKYCFSTCFATPHHLFFNPSLTLSGHQNYCVMRNSFDSLNHFFSSSIFCLVIGWTAMSFTVPNQTASPAMATWDNCPTASFTTNNNGCEGPCEITFINQSLNASSYHWDFGDGQTSTAIHPQHVYQSAGSYTVTLTAIIDGCSVSFIGIVDILEG